MKITEWKKKENGESRYLYGRTVEFKDFGELLTYSEQRPPGCMSDEDRGNDSKSLSETESRFHGSANMGEAMHLARYGWPEGRALVEAITATLEGITASKLHRPQMAYAVAGDSVDVGRFVTGEPECMQTWEEVEQEQHGKIVRLEVNLSASSGISPQQMAIRGAAACALIDALETCGKSVELVASWGVEGDHHRLEFYVPVKTAGEQMEIDRLAFMMAHASMFRRIGFAAMENQPGAPWREKIGVTYPGAYGMPSDCTGGEFKPDITVPKMLLGSTAGACVEWVLETLREYGIQLEGV